MTELPALDPAGLPSVGEKEMGAELSLFMLEPAGLLSVGEDETAVELELGPDSLARTIGVEAELGLLLPEPKLELVLDLPAGTTEVEAELGPLLPETVDDPAGDDEFDAWPDAGTPGVVAPDEAIEEESAGLVSVWMAPEGAEPEDSEAGPVTEDWGGVAVPLGRAFLSEV